MATDTPYLRQARLTVMPAAGGQGQAFFSDGSRDSYYLSFDITRSLIDVANESSFTLKNLNDQTRQQLQTGFSKVMLEAGWSTGKMSTFYVGNLMRAVSVRQGPDIVTTLLCINAGENLLTTPVNRTWPANTPIVQVLKDIVALLPGVTWDAARVSPSLNEWFVASGGLSVPKSARDALDDLSLQCGFTWSIQDSTFQALAHGESFNRTLALSTAAGTLFRVVPTLTTAFQLKLGVEVDALLVASLLPGDSCQVTSTVSPNLNGVYMMNKIQYCGSPMENDWRMHLTAFALGG